MLETMVELAEEFVEQMSGGCGMPVAVLAPLTVMPAGGLICGGGREGPHPADIGQPIVFNVTVGDRDRAAGSSGDRCRSGVGLECSRVGEPGAVIADLSKHAGPSRVGQPGETGDDLIVGMGPEQFGGRLAKLVDIRARGVECS